MLYVAIWYVSIRYEGEERNALQSSSFFTVRMEKLGFPLDGFL